MPDPLDELMSGSERIPPAPELSIPDRTDLMNAVLGKGDLEASQPFQQGTLTIRAMKPVNIAFQNDVFQIGFAEATGDLSKFDDGQDEIDEEDVAECGEVEQPAGYPVMVATFSVRVTGWTVVADNFWRYGCQRIVPPLSGNPTASTRYVADATLDQACDPTTFQAWNMNEMDNDGNDIEGPGMATEAQPYVDCGLSMKPLQQGVYPCWRYKQADGSLVHFIYGANDHSP